MEERWVPNGSATPIYCLSDGATCSCCYALLSRRAAPRCRWWWPLRCCAPRPGGKELANSSLVGLQLVVAVIWVDCLESFLGRGSRVCCGLEGLLVFLFLCAGAFLALLWSCVLRGSFVFYLSEGLTAVYRHPNVVFRVGWACLLDARHNAWRSRILDHQTSLHRLGVTVTPGANVLACSCSSEICRGVKYVETKLPGIYSRSTNADDQQAAGLTTTWYDFVFLAQRTDA